MEGLGRVFNVIAVASGIHVPLKNATAVTFVVYEDGGATQIGIKESIAGASEQTLAVVDHYYASGGVAATTWTRETADANGSLGSGDASIVKKDTTPFDCMVFSVDASQLSDGFDSVEVTVDGGNVLAIVHDLAVQRTPANLAAIGA